jgi:hypothetical protein
MNSYEVLLLCGVAMMFSLMIAVWRIRDELHNLNAGLDKLTDPANRISINVRTKP